MTTLKKQCVICKKDYQANELFPLGTIRSSIAMEIMKTYPDLEASDFICDKDLFLFRNQHIEHLLQDEKGELTNLEKDVVSALKDHELISEHPELKNIEVLTIGDKLSDGLAAFGGSWKFIILFTLTITVWIFVNSFFDTKNPFDPYPFILLNLILSCIAAIQAPVIMMSQNRKESKDRLRSEYDYRINLKAELEIRHLHEKIDHLLKHQWDRLVEIQQVQIEILEELSEKKKS